MKKIIMLMLVLISLKSYSQTDTVIWYDSLKVFRIDTAIIYANDTVTTDSNYVWQYYHFTKKDNDTTFNYQPQFVIYDKLNNKLLPNKDLSNNGWRSSGTVKEFIIDSIKANWSVIQLRDSLIFPDLQLIYGNSNVIKL